MDAMKPRPIRPFAHRLPPHRRRAHRAVQLALRPPHRRHVHPAHRGHRRRAQFPGGRGRHPQRPALARPRLGRRPAHRRRHRPEQGRLRPVFPIASARKITSAASKPCSSHGLAYEHEGAVKFKMQREPITIPDLVVGDVVRKLTDREEADPDFVIQRSDGQPVFHLVNVIDDLEMDITHVIRGEDHLSNTAKHIALFQAFGVQAAALRPHPAHPERRRLQDEQARHRARRSPAIWTTGFCPRPWSIISACSAGRPRKTARN